MVFIKIIRESEKSLQDDLRLTVSLKMISQTGIIYYTVKSKELAKESTVTAVLVLVLIVCENVPLNW